ncbi:MAG: hypothetical protein AB9846_17820 [Tenuifilaceae bacterium]
MKKQLGNMGERSKNLGKINTNFFPEDKTEVKEAVTKKQEVTTTKENNKSTKTFEMYDKDYNFLKRYARIMASKKDDKYPLREAISDAIKLLRKEHPEIPND